MSNRRNFLQRAFGLSAALLADRRLAAAQMPMQMPMPEPTGETPAASHANPASHLYAAPHSQASPHAQAAPPVITPDVGDLPYTLDNGTKVFHLTAEPVKQLIAPGKTVDLWGYNGSAPGPTIQVNEGDHVRVLVDNHLPEPTSMHWHGFEDEVRFDGMPGISQDAIRPGGRFTYEFDIHQSGTYFYHSHMAMQEMAGLLGGFIMHPRTPHTPRCDKDFLVHLQEYAVPALNTIPNTQAMEFNWLLLNGKAAPSTTPLLVRLGERVRIRFVNLGMDHHPMHLHGNTFHTTGTEAGRIPQSAWWPGNTVLVGVAQARDVEFNATRLGDWMLHCHLPHHMMNQMASNAGPITRTPPPDASPTANAVPNFPQDAYMEGPTMTHTMSSTSPAASMPDMPGMSLATRPEDLGLRPGWQDYSMGMMTFVRVLPHALYDQIVAGLRTANRPNDPYGPIFQEAV